MALGPPQDVAACMKGPLRIAVADDEPDLREFLHKTLTRQGHNVVAVAQDGQELVELCRAVGPDLIITDITMPVLDGIAAAEEICRTRPVPIILVSAHYDEDLLRRAEASHAFAYLVKPIRSADLLPAIAIARRRFADLQSMENLALTDELTGLYNRRGFLSAAAQQVKAAQRRRQTLCLLYLDVDGLKRINDAAGHEQGDQVLRATADLLRQTFRGSDVLGRMGGDEFCVLVCADSGENGALSAIRRLGDNLARYNAQRRDQDAFLSLSIGAVEIDPAADFPVEESVATADKRMYAHKREKAAAGSL